jgi:phage/plasmid primase-like uncharacterized protein
VFTSDNLQPVAKALHDAHPKARFIICGDDDWKAKDPGGKPINPGRTQAMNVARAFGAEVAFPVFSPCHYRSDREKLVMRLDGANYAGQPSVGFPWQAKRLSR